MVSDSPISAEQLVKLLDELNLTTKEVKSIIEQLHHDYIDRGIELVEVASGYRFQASATYQEWFHRLLQEKPQKYSKALLETLAIIAYRQPVTRADIEAIRGVAVSSSIIKTLIEREWVRVVGHRDVPGKPSIYATTKDFLDYFNLSSLSELPPLSEVKDLTALMKSNATDSEQLRQNDAEVAAEHLEARAVEAKASADSELAFLEPQKQQNDEIDNANEAAE